MPSQTNFAKLSLYNNSSDATTKYGEFRAAIAGVDTTSNMNKIDKILQQNDTDIKSLKSKDEEIDLSISSINEKISTNISDISNLKEKDSQHDSQISDLSSRISNNTSNISKNAEDIKTANEDISNLTQKVTKNESDISNLQSSKAVTVTYTANIPVSWTGEQAPYTQTVSVSEIKSTDNPLVDIVLNDNTETAIKELENYGKISRIQTSDGSITITCLEERPEVALNIQLKVVR